MLYIDKFIALVEEEGALWDVGSAAYKDENEVDRAWKTNNIKSDGSDYAICLCDFREIKI